MAKIGRPRKYETAEQLAAVIKHYFDSITITRPAVEKYVDGIDAKGKPIYKERPVITNAGTQFMEVTWITHPSIVGLCLHLGISRQTLSRYAKDAQFRDTIMRARARVEAYVAGLLYDPNSVSGAMFNLKNNFGWKEAKQHRLAGENGGPSQTEDVSYLTGPERKARIEELLAKRAT